MRATVHLDPRRNRGPVDRRIFGGFLEHLGRAVYGGVYEPGPRADARGFRTDVAEAIRALRMPVVRYPGGNFVSNYDWRDGVGPRESRPLRRDFAWQSIEPNTFGTDEFLEWCSLVGTEPMLAVNLGTLGPREAASLVEYCSGRARLWCLGNEMDGPWQAGHTTADRYAEKALTAGRLMKGMDERIELAVCGSSARSMPTYMEWDRVVLEHCWDAVEYISAHRYSRNAPEDTPSFLAEGVVVDAIIDDYRSLLGYVRARKRSSRNVYLSFDEWNVWYKNRTMRGGWTHAPRLLEEVYNLEDALVDAQFLMSFIRNADVVKIACIAQIVNVIAPLLAEPDGLLRQTIYWPLEMLSSATSGLSLVPVVESPRVATSRRGDVPALDASATLDEGTLTVALVNRSTQDALDVTVSGVQVRSIREARLLHASDVKLANTWAEPDAVAPQPIDVSVVDGALRATLPAPSFAVVVAR